MKVLLEDIEVQLSLGKAEARDAFERERKNFRTYIRQQKEEMKDSANNNEKNSALLNEQFNVLEKYLQKDTPESKRAFDAQKKQTLKAIYELEATLKESYGGIGLLMLDRLGRFKSKLDSYRIQLALGEFEDAESLKVRKEELLNAVREVKQKFDKQNEAGEKIDQFAEEVVQSFEHMKKAFSELFS
ncbi:MAG: hypothetical protein EPO28_02200 [Saprospiraceae bacterium]|nr:MAG: hypothetical protein EPO28_02200 [Saprospiraceae bacterium]